MRSSLVVLALFTGVYAPPTVAQKSYAKVGDIPIGGPLPAQWDYLTVDAPSKRAYVSHGSEVVVIDTATDRVVGRIADTPGVHGIAVGAGKVFTSNGRENKVSVVDPKTLATSSKIDSGGANPDAITFDPTSTAVWVFNHTGKSATEIDATTGTVRSTIALTGTAESGQADGAGKVFVNIEDKDQIDVIDIAAKKVSASWPVAPGIEPDGDVPGPRQSPSVRRRRERHADDGRHERQGPDDGTDLLRHRRHLVRRRHQAGFQLVPGRPHYRRSSRW